MLYRVSSILKHSEKGGQALLLSLLPFTWNTDMTAKFPKAILDYEAMHQKAAKQEEIEFLMTLELAIQFLGNSLI